jgi:predicted TPR repeat methyltransferase
VGAQRADLRRRVHPVHRRVLNAADLGTARRVLDVGCGTGTLLEAAVSAGAAAVGVDISSAMVDAARRRVPAATVVTADAQTADLLAAAPGAPFDRVVSRFGVMFFVDPETAFANIRSATASGARPLCAGGGETDVWLGLRAPHGAVIRPPRRCGAPGDRPASADRMRGLTVAGWSDVTISRPTGHAISRSTAATASRNAWRSP